MNAIELLLDLLEKGKMPVLAKVQPSNERLQQVYKTAMDQLEELIRIAKFVHSKPSGGDDPDVESLYYFYTPLLVDQEIYLIELEVGGKNDKSSMQFLDLKVGLIEQTWTSVK